MTGTSRHGPHRRRSSDRPHARRVGRAAAVAAAVLLLTACGPTARTDRADPAPSSVALLEDFARGNGLTALPRDRVTIGAGARTLVVDVLVADTAARQARGLQGVTDVPTGVGMLFAFDGPSGPSGRPGFWMLETLVPLDIAFVADGTVVGVATMTPCAARPCPITHPGVDYDLALEVGAGVLSDAGVTVGDVFVRRGSAAG